MPKKLCVKATMELHFANATLTPVCSVIYCVCLFTVEITYGESNGHVTNDATWPQKVKLVIPIHSEPNILKTAGDASI